MAAASRQAVCSPVQGEEEAQLYTNRLQEEDIEKKALWLKTKLREGPINGPSSLKTYREDIRQILYKEYNSPVTDLDISRVVHKAFPSHSKKGKYYLGLGTANPQYAVVAGRTITTDNLKSLMTIQSDTESRDPSPVMLKPVKKRAIQAWRETENGQAFAADQMIRDANNQTSAPVVTVSTNDGGIRPQWSPMFVRLPHHLQMPPRGMLFPTGALPGTIQIPHAAMVTSEPNNNINRGIPSSRGGRKRPSANQATFQKLNYGAERVGKKPRKEGAMIELSSTRNGLIAERPNLAAMHIQPIILDFEVPVPKLPLPKPASESSPEETGFQDETSVSNKQNRPNDLSSTIHRSSLDGKPFSPHAAESAEWSGPVNKSSSPLGEKDSPGKTTESSAKSANPFKKPDIDNYRTNVSAGRCFLCQNPIPPNSRDASGTVSAITICMKCTKVSMTGSKSLSPVPKFPYACNPKLAPRTVYVPPPRSLFRPRPPPPSGPQKAVGIRLYPPRSHSSKSSSSKSTSASVQSPSAPPRSPGQLSVPGSPAPSLPVGSPQPPSPSLITHSAPPSPRQTSDAGHKMKTTSLSLPSSPSTISPQRLASPAPNDTGDADAVRTRPLTSTSLQVPSPAYSSNPSTPGGRDSCSSERLSLPPGREQDDATIKALLQLGRGVDRVSLEHGIDNMSTPSPRNRSNERETTPHPYQNSSIPIPNSPVPLPPGIISVNVPVLPGQVPMIPSNTGVVMGPGGQLQPIVPSWPFGVPTTEAISMLSQGVYPPMPFFIQPPSSRESSSPVVAPSDSMNSDVRSRNLWMDSAKPSSVGSSPEIHFDISQMKHRKGYKRSRLADRVSDSPTGSIGYEAEQTQDDKSKSKKSIVIVGTNCAGSSSVKVGTNNKESSYHQEEVSRETAEMYGKPFSAFCCRCSGREIILLQCTDCDFVCNNKFGMELHIAAQRHAESRNKTVVPEVVSRHANEADDWDEVASESSVETQSADTDTDAASPPPARIPREAQWSRVIPDANNQLQVTSWQDKVLQFMPSGRNFTQGQVTMRVPSMTSRASFFTAPSYGSFGTVTENTVPLDLSGRTFQAPPYLPGISPSSFANNEQSKERPVEEPSPLDLSGYSRSPIMSTIGDCSMQQQFSSNQGAGAHGSMTTKKPPLDQQSLPIPSLVLTSSPSKKTTQPPPPQTFFDLMRRHGVPVSTSPFTTTFSSSKSIQSPIPHSKLSTVHSSTGSSSPTIRKTHFDYPSSPKSSPLIPSIVLSSSTHTTSSVPKCSSFPTTELTRPPPGVIAAPCLTQSQFLNYQGGTISVRPTIPFTHTHVSSKTVPVLSPFPLPVSGLASTLEMRHSPGRESSFARGADMTRECPSMDSLHMHVNSPTINLGSPSMGPLTFRGSPKARQRFSAPESPREYLSQRDSSPIRSSQPLHIKIEPPDSVQEEESCEKGEQQWHVEAENQEKLLEASLNNTSVHSVLPSPGFLSGRSGIGRTTWSITSKSLQIRDNSFVNTTTSLPRPMQLGTRTDNVLSRNSPGNASHCGAKESYPVVNNNLDRLSSTSMCSAASPTTENHHQSSREELINAKESMLLGHPISKNDRSKDSVSPNTEPYADDRRQDHVDSVPGAVSPSAWQIKVEK